MTTTGFLACATTLPGSPMRREDAFEHDLMVGAIEPALRAAGLSMRVIDWEEPIGAFAGLDLVMLGTAWNYQDRAGDFLARLDELEARGIAVCNPAPMVRWNISKTYLRDLSGRGAKTIPTLWLDRVTAQDAEGAFDRFDCDKLVVKRQVGAGAEGQELLARGAIPAGWSFERAAMVQPFLPAIVEEGELSFVFIDGELSHTLRKRAADGDYRIQSLYGGRESRHEPAEDEVRAARTILEALPFDTPLYARIDMLRGDEGLLLMEAELIEPYLYPEQGPDLGERIARAIAKRLET
jgi:glutathione synthase/RimK-type ligase-like ATP-grasp enzyme